MKATSILLAVLTSTGIGCSNLSVHKLPLPGYITAKSLPKAAEKTIVLNDDSTDFERLPLLSPYMEIRCAGQGRSRRQELKILETAKAEKPDYVIFAKSESFLSGFVSNYWGYGITTTQGMYTNIAVARLFRIVPCSLGFTFNADNVVTSRQSQSVIDSGVQEGDVLYSMDNWPITLNNYHNRLLSYQPGNVVNLVWSRPGTGRMEGKVELTKNKPRTPSTPKDG